MSRLFFDHLVVFERINLEIKEVVTDQQEREELWNIVDEIVHHNVLSCVLDILPNEHHDDFLEKYHSHPHDSSLVDYLNEKTEDNVEDFLRERIKKLEEEILQEIRDF
jgi:hypothetical protein